ncbi:hypothetical protein [Hymenobacter weizhouensis]|uniref:hypothetical protein n=1 Tax=Hymenobacter sp. YIM 151500-1 TaxID=2987689 RepID=UPI0022267902|nr:hypothetical protein [Hymenobacter sp. YIM 151500-1]UYZ64326.1 hypothetical protein OIS53_05615 [Hymenobacter sp. YIM 151500-1]
MVLNAVLVLALRRWLRRVRPLPGVGHWVLPTLVLKAAVTALSVVLLSEDARYFLVWSGRMTEQLWQDPGAWLRMLPADEFHHGRWHLVFHGYSNTFFLLKVLSAVNLASAGNALLTAGYLSLANFVAAWELVRQLRRRWPQAPAGAGVVALLLWPTVLYWTSGLTKESLLVASGYVVLALVLRLGYGPAPVRPGLVLPLLLAAAVLHFKMRYFLAIVLLGALAGLGLVRAVQALGVARWRWGQAVVLLGFLAASAWAASEVSPVFRANKFTSQLLRNYSELVASSRGRPHLEYPALAPTAASALQHAPQAAANTLARPWPWEGRGLYTVAGLENLLLLAVLGVAVVATVRGRPGHLPFALVLALLLYCLVVAALLGLTTPNLGTLNRYRVSFLPFLLLLLLLLQNDYAARFLRRLER